MPHPPPLDKSALRASLRARRRRLAAAWPDAARRAVAHLPIHALPSFRVVGGYHPVGTELDPQPVLEALAAAGAVIALPVAVGPGAPLIFRAAGDAGAFVPDALGIPAPPPSAPVLIPDLIVAPLLAFDAQGGRLGQGGGHFDATIAAIRAASPLFVIGLAFAGQEVDAVPLEPHDQRLDAILTEIGYRAVAKD